MIRFFRRFRPPQSFRKYLAFVLIVPLGYLFQVCVLPYLRVGGVTPNLLYVNVAVITVAYGPLQALWAGLIYGLLMEIMLPSVPFVNLAVYPISSLFVSFAFTDKSLRRIQMERALKRDSHDIPPFLRTVLCAVTNVTVFETVNVIYIYLQGTALTPQHIERAALDVVLTGVLAVFVGLILRRIILGRTKREPVLKRQPIVFGKK